MVSVAGSGFSSYGAVGVLPADSVVFGCSEAMQVVRQKVEKVVATNVPVLICGESGTGKEIVARLIHQRSPWEDGQFVKVHCPAIPGTLLESELFGYEKGAFTGASGVKPGRVELAHRGTLFLDEIAELDPVLQAKLLQLLQDGQFCRIGATEDKRVDVRVICATNRDLQEEIRAGTFRQDLFYRINVVSMYLPPLRERRADLPQLVNYFLRTLDGKFNSQARPVSPRLMQSLQRYDWPGNIRELENVVKRYVILGNEEAILGELASRAPSALDPQIVPGAPISLKRLTRSAVQELERKIILKVLQAHNWNRKEAARALNIGYRTLLYKIKEAGLPQKRMPAVQRPVGLTCQD